MALDNHGTVMELMGPTPRPNIQNNNDNNYVLAPPSQPQTIILFLTRRTKPPQTPILSLRDHRTRRAADTRCTLLCHSKFPAPAREVAAGTSSTTEWEFSSHTDPPKAHATQFN
jgi:hypothetical protein